MRNFIIRTFLFGLVATFSIGALTIVLSKIVERRGFGNAQSESNLLFDKLTSYDFAFLGISHARNFSRHGNHQRVEKILDGTLLNLAQGSAKCGVNEQHFYYEYFVEKDVEVKTLVYVVSPPMLFVDFLNQASDTFEFEPFRTDFFWKYMLTSSDNKSQRLFQYVQSKFHPLWIGHRPDFDTSNDHILEAVDQEIINTGRQMVYLSGENQAIFSKNSSSVEKTIRLAQSNGTRVILMIPPAVFGKWLGHDETVHFFDQMKNKYGVEYYDFSLSILDKKYYYDHHHLNTEGVELFVSQFLKPMLDSTTP